MSPSVCLYRFFVACLVMAATLVSASSNVSAQPLPLPWDLKKLSQTPALTWLDQTSPIRSLTYRSEEYNGKPTDVFAFYATPGTLKGTPNIDRNLPAIVLIHGGGGTAFAEWVELWAKRGYAAIAMDLSGRRPQALAFDSKTGQRVNVPLNKAKRQRLPNGGPEQGHPAKFDSIGGDVQDDWPLHAVAAAIRAHSLIRSFEEVDAERTAVTGISWGGYTTCLVASVDHRFKAAVPVYGCGFLYVGESVQKPALDKLEPESRRQLWIKRYDPSSHLARVKMPILFVNGTNDKHYVLDSYSRSYGLVDAALRRVRIEPHGKHSHQAGWKPKEIGLFIDHHLLGTFGLVEFGQPRANADGVVVEYEAPVPLKEAKLWYTADDGLRSARNWQSLDAVIKDGRIIAPALPGGANTWIITATDERDAMMSTEAQFAN